MPNNFQLADAIEDDPSLLGIPHSKLDCQAAVEKALSLVGVTVNYRGSNHMWRDMVYDRISIDQFRTRYGELTPGLICFTLKHDGSEVKRGYHDDMGAAVHVGIILDNQTCFQSASRGTEIIDISRTTFNQVARCKYISYDDATPQSTLISKLNDLYDLIHTALQKVEEVRHDYTGTDRGSC